MIIEFTNPLAIPKLIKLAEVVPNTPIEKLKHFMFLTLNKPDTKAYIDVRDEEYRGFIYGSLVEFDCEKCVFIQFCVIKPGEEEKHTGFELLTKMKLWAAENKCKSIYFSTSRNMEGFIKKYHFSFHSTILKYDLTEESK